MATKRHCCIRFCCEKEHDHTSAGAQSAPSDEKGHDPTSAGARSSPSAIDSPIENLPGAPKRPEAPISGTVVCESSNVPGCNEAPSTSSSRGSIRHTDIAKVDGKYVVDVDKLIEHISDLFKQREEEKHLHQNASNPRNFHWPDDPGLTNLKKILHFGTDLRNLNESLSAGLKCVSDLKDIISGPVKTFLRDIGQVSIATAGLLVVAYTLERFDDLSTNKEKCWELLKEMRFFATVFKRLKENSKRMQGVIEEETTALLVEGAIMCCAQIDRSAWKRFFETSKIKADLSDIRQKLNLKYNQINIEIDLLLLSESKGRSLLSRKYYPKHAVGIDESVQEVLGLLECESEEKAVTVILHGFGGMGKTTLADAVFSRVGGCRYSHVQLFKDIDSKPDITKLQTDILKDLMEPGEAVPDIRKSEDGQRELGEMLERVHAFIYIDNVLKGDALKNLLPPDMNTAKKVRFLLTARDEHVKIVCRRWETAPKIYKMKGIQHPEAMLILKRKIKEGLDDDQFKDIIQICGKIPLMLTLAAAFIGHADNIPDAYSTLMLQKDKWASEDFNEKRYAFFYDAQSAPSHEKGHDPTPAGAQSAPSEEKGHDPTPAGDQSAPSDEKGNDPTPAGAQSAPSDEKAHDPTPAGAQSLSMEFDGRSHFHAFQISSTDLERLQNLRILRLVNFSKLTKLIFLSYRKDRAQRVIKSMMEDFEGGVKEMHDQDPGVSESLIKNMQTAVEQENMDSLRNYISELRGVELYQLLNVNKEAKKWSRPKVTWPTSRSFCMLKDFLSEGTNADWVKDVISRHPEEETKYKPVIKSLLSGIEEANWAVAGLLAVADVLERFETVSANQIEWSVFQIQGLFILHAMLRLAQYIGQVNKKPGLWRNIKRVATAGILECCIVCCNNLIDPSKFALFDLDTGKLRQLEEGLIKQCDLMKVTEGLDESGSFIKQMCAGLGKKVTSLL